MSAVEILNQQIQAIEDRRNELFKIREPIDEELVSSYNALSQLRNERDTLLLPEKENDWEWLLHTGESDSSMIRLRAAETQLAKIGLNNAGSYNPDTQQRIISIALTKGDGESFETTLRGMETILPFIKPTEDGYKRISILEHTCGQHRSYYLMLKKGGYLISNGSTWDRGKKFSTLREALGHIQENLWYQNRTRGLSQADEGDD